MDTREGQFLKYIAPEHFTEVYKRVQANAREDHQRLIGRVEQLKKSIKISRKATLKGYLMHDFEMKYPNELRRAEEHLERFIAANADYLI
jgi:hypothetical protein